MEPAGKPSDSEGEYRILEEKMNQGDRDPSKVFTLLEKLGEGAYGSVFKGIHNETGSVVAVKLIPIEGEELDETVKEISFMRDVKNENLVRFFGKYLHRDKIWIIIEMCGGGAIQDILRETKKGLNEHQLATVLKPTLEGLVYLHDKGKIHRDIKAGNILLTDSGEPKIADFGVSGQLGAEMKRITVIGTPFWMAPEVIEEVGYDQMADIWSLGITTIEMVERKPPFSNLHPMQALFKIPEVDPPTLQDKEKYSEELNDFIACCLQKEPQKRPDARVLLEHPFIKKFSKTPDTLIELIEEYKLRAEEKRARGELSSDDDDSGIESISDVSSSDDDDGGFMQDSDVDVGDSSDEDSSDGDIYDTMVALDDKDDSSDDELDEMIDYSTTVVSRSDDDSDDDADAYATTVVSRDDDIEEGETIRINDLVTPDDDAGVSSYQMALKGMQDRQEVREKNLSKVQKREEKEESKYSKMSAAELRRLLAEAREKKKTMLEALIEENAYNIKCINERFDKLIEPIKVLVRDM